jgi:hypothetical protein
MSALNARNKTLAEIRTELRERLGFQSTGPAASGNTRLLNSFMQEGHDLLYDQLKPTPARKITTIRLMPGQTLYDYHNDIDDENIDPGTVKNVWVSIGSIPTILTQGITVQHRAFVASRSYPERYDTIAGQLEVWPIPAAQYDLSIEYLEPKPRFVQDQDRPGVYDRLIFLYALANAKAHYRHPDATATGASFEQLLRSEKSKMHENRRYVMPTGSSEAERAQVVSNPDGTQTMRIG